MKPKRLFAVAFAAMSAFTAILVAIGTQVYVHPRVDDLRRADAILVLGGHDPNFGRWPYGFQLASDGWARQLVISIPKTDDDFVRRYCEQKREGFVLRCFVADPPTTRGEAQKLGQLAATYGWRKVIVVTFRPHISRARFILRKCFHGDLIMIESPTPVARSRWFYEFLYQTGGYVRAALQREC